MAGCERADGAEDEVDGHAREAKRRAVEVGRVAADRAIEAEERGREDLLVVVAGRVEGGVEGIESDAPTPSPSRPRASGRAGDRCSPTGR